MSDQLKHTPGPWTIRHRMMTGENFVTDADGLEICTFPLSGTNGQEADAHLIEAAPDLLAELDEADGTICVLCRRLNPQHALCESCEERETRLAVMAKAKGAP